MLALARIFIGCVLIVSGFEKLISPIENFLYVVQSYEIGNPIFNDVASQAVPWIELFTGVFLVLGLWIHFSLRLAWFLFLGFILMVMQAIWRGLPLDECGCFGSIVSISPALIIVLDTTTLVVLTLLKISPEKTSQFGLDRYFQKKTK
ncbi:MAG: MauE/DoxX family redox-associated membrane protein [Candidatus Omnitrophota bacterium]